MKNKILKNLFIVLVFIFLYLPILALIAFSFNDSKLNIVFEGFTLEWYKTLFTNTTLLESLGNTLIVAITSTVISTIVGTIAAIGLYKYDFKGKDFINSLLYIPVVIPEIVLGISLLSIYTLMKLNLGLGTLIISHIAFSIPYVIISIRTVISSMNWQIEEAAHDLGASDFLTFRKIILPEITPGIISGATLAFTLSLDDVIISYFTTGPGSNTLPLQIYSMIKTGITPDVNALTTLIILVVMIILFTSTIIQARKLKKGYQI
ncbi:MAG TPA: ABC transporter permease [Candidatus Onthocola stercoravium]|nr:ABC transporter permease [Candidatus Onthocola stercoravium]